MHRLNPKYIRIAVIVLLSFLVILVIAGSIAYSKRATLLASAISKAKIKAKRDYNLDINIGSAGFTGLSTVAFTDITIIPEDRDSILSIKKFDVSVKLFPLIYGAIKLGDVNLENAHLNLTDINKVKNFDFLFKKKKKDSTSTSKADLSELANNLVKGVLYKIPDNLTLKNFNVTFTDDSTQLRLLTQTAMIKDGHLTSTINVDNGASIWHLDGKMHPSDKDIDVKLYADGKKVELPIIEKKFKIKINFDTVSTKLTSVERSGGETRIYGSWGVKNLLINHHALSADNILLPDASIDANLFIGENYVSVDSSSVIRIKKMIAHPYIKYTLNPVKIYELKVNTGWLDAQDIFDSLPAGIFDELAGMQVAGKLDYKLNIFLNAAKPDDVQFDSRLDKDDFRIIRYGATDLRKLNAPFVYTAYEHGKPMPSRIIGDKNPDYTPLEGVSRDVRNAVMTSEDPSFYTNHGFVEESIRQSLATDFKDKKFKRGGSTISMQLVKNTFLSRGKTIGRKIEEIMIVWLIENNQLMSKNRMLEVYFNIVEWGRNVYGIGEAARYYFGKTPSQLTLGEGIYLASILPNPKNGLYAFLPDGSLRPGLHGYFNLIGKLMANKGLTERDSTGYGFYNVRLKESLRREIVPVDTATADSLMKHIEDDDAPVPLVIVEEPKKPNFIQRLFGKKDTVAKKEEVKLKSAKERLKEDIQKIKDDEKKKELLIDTAGKTKKEIRQEKRRLRDEAKDQEKVLKEKFDLQQQ